MARVTIKEASRRLGVAEATIRRRIHRGDLVGVQITTPQGFSWLVEVPDEDAQEQANVQLKTLVGRESLETEVQALRDLVELLRYDLKVRDQELEARRQEIRELHALLQQAHTKLFEPSAEK